MMRQTQFSPFLSAFQKMYNCQSALMHLVESWTRALDKDENVEAIMMDLSKAFDCISHELLIAKLSAYGFSNNACKFILNYLSNQQQRVKIDQVFSSWIDLTKGIPLGSIRAPIIQHFLQ